MYPKYELNESVKLVVDEGLDTPLEQQGEIGVITKVYPANPKYPEMVSYDVTMPNGEVVYCEVYHIEKI